MSTGGQHRITVALAVVLATTVIVAMYVLRVHALRLEPGLLRVSFSSASPYFAEHLTGKVLHRERLIAHVTLDHAGAVLVPDLAVGTYRLSVSFLDREIATQTIEIREGLTQTTLHEATLRFPFTPTWNLWRRTPASRPDFTNRALAREVYALVGGHLAERTGYPVLVEREAAHSGGLVIQNPAHPMIPVADSIRRALREQAHRQVVWHHDGIFPPTLIPINKADVPATREGHALWRARLGLNETQHLRVFSVSRVFVSDEGTQAIVFAHDFCSGGCGRGDLFWLKRSTPADAWSIERVDLLWIN
jgi:hypothetical protein